MNNLPLPNDSDTVIALFTLQLDPKFELFFLLSVIQVHNYPGAVALDVKEKFFYDEIGAVYHY